MTGQQNFLELYQAFRERVKEALDAAGIEIPFPQRTVHLHTASARPAKMGAAETTSG